MKNKYSYQRYATIPVKVGGVTIGGNNPIVIQSMADVDTNDVGRAAEQALRIMQAGGRLVRFTTQGGREVGSLVEIRGRLRNAGCDVPIVADVHFNAKVAMAAVRVADKVRINPGNLVPSRLGSYSDQEYAAELKQLEKVFGELLDSAVSYDTAIRVGVNHGSLSSRIMSRYGDTPAGMVESAMELLRVAKGKGFSAVVVSMKSSNPAVMAAAYRLLVETMAKEDMAFPLHLGVTESGEGIEGRVRSAIGIGDLLNDGIGDTIRVSLTEPPENEIPVARFLACHYDGRTATFPDLGDIPQSLSVPFIVTDESAELIENDIRYLADEPRFVWVDSATAETALAGRIAVINGSSPQEHRYLYTKIKQHNPTTPVVLFREYTEDSPGKLAVMAAADLGALLMEGTGDALWIRNRGEAPSYGIAKMILQASRRRITSPEYISCPGCGRTRFDIQSVVRGVKEHTGHLGNVRIAVMGCIVNGPGEMADADYGYIGAGNGEVVLYYKGAPVGGPMPEENALKALLELIERTG